MSTLALSDSSAHPRAAEGPRLSLARVIRAEWIKLTSLRSNWWMLLGVFGLIVLTGLIAAATASGDLSASSGGPEPFGVGDDPTQTVLSGTNIAVLIVGVLGALVGAREYSSGMISATLAAVPTRLPVLWGKLSAAAGLLAPTVLAGVLTAFFGGMAILDAAGKATAGFLDAGVAQTVLGTAAYLVGIGLMGVALGVLLRGIAAAIGILIGVVLFLSTLASALLPDAWDSVLAYLPANAGQAFTSIGTAEGQLLSAGAGAAVFIAWVVAAVGAAAVSLVQRDV
jgi:ABC-2 type transport system permease protein